jgi:VWFA-related protein
MDAVVTDNRGNLVRDLAPADFAIYEGNQPRTVVAFASVDTLSGASRAAEPLPLAAKIDPGEAHRTFMLVADDAGMSAASAAALRAALAGFVNEQMGARDVASLVRSVDGTGPLQQLTSDHRLLAAAGERVAFNPAARPPSVPPWPETLRYALEGLRAVRGRKAVMLFWERAPENYDFGPLIALANRAWSSVYPVHLGPLPDGPPGGMARLAKETGGLSLAQEIPAALARVLQDQESYYLLGFPAELLPGQENPVSVKLLRPGLELRSRASVPEMVPPRVPPEAGLPANELARLIASPLNSGSLQVSLAALFSHTTTDGLDVLLRIDGHGVAMTHRLDGAHEAGLDFLLRVCGMNGEVLYDRGTSNSLRLTADEYRRVMDEGLNYAIAIPVAGPGVLQVRAAVLDATSSNTGIAHCLIEIPDVSKGELLLSGIVLEPAADAAASGAGLDSARRFFHAGQRIAYRCSIYNASVDSQQRAAMEVRTAMYYAGRTVWTSDPIPLTAADADRQTIKLRGNLEFARDTGAGEFVLQVTVTDTLAPGGKPRSASQWTTFTLR